MMQKRTSAAEATPVRVAIVTLDSHLSNAVARAQTHLRRELPGLTLEVHAADEWASDPAALDRCQKALAESDFIIATMLFLEDHIRAVLPTLQQRRESCDAMLCGMSAGEVVKLTRLGRFNMSEEAVGAIGLLKKMRPKAKSGSSGLGQMKMLRALPKMLRFIPGKAQDVRSYFLGLQYWIAGSEENLANLVRMMIDRYATGERSHLRGRLKVTAPTDYPDVGLYHPHARTKIFERIEHLPRGGAAGTVGLLVLRSYVLAGNTGHYDGVIASLEAKGMRVIPAFSAGLDNRPAIEQYFLQGNRPIVDAVVSLTGFSLVGGPAYNDARAAEEILAKLDVPYIGAHPLEFQTVEKWQGDARGLMPVEATMMVAIPELDGAIWPMTFGGRSSAANGEAKRDMVALPERTAMLAARVLRLVELRRRNRADRKIAILLFNFPPNSGSTGTAAYLSVFESLHLTLLALKAQGYSVDVPETVDALRSCILEGNSARYGADANVVARISTDDHVRRQRWLPEIERQWGPAPGRQQSDGRSIFVLGERFGNIVVGIQPAFGYEGDPMRLLFERGFTPTHAFVAFYRWLREDFSADAILNFGTHGALEFMPGKQAGLSSECWPDRLISDLPNFYIYASNNPSEGTLAKRRTGAALISYLTPPVTKAGLYRGLVDLKASVDRWRGLDADVDHVERDALASLIQAQAAAVDLAEAEPVWGSEATAEIERLCAAVLELEYSLIPHGLHIIGVPPDQAMRAEMLDAAGVDDPERRAKLDLLLATDSEIPAILHALDGGYLHPAPGGDLIRNTAVLPTGRNLHGFDPFSIPSAFAIRDGALQAERILSRHAADGLGIPETIAIVLWGSDNLKSEGGPIGQALWLMGAAPRHDSYGRLSGAQLVPLDTLGRPRIDVLTTLSGVFRDLLPMQTKLLAEAALLAASAEEPVERNFVRKHVLEFQAVHGGDIEQAALRVFGNADSAYGANVNQLVDSGGWSEEDELADSFVRRKGFAYGMTGEPVRQEAVLSQLLTTVDAAYQNLDSVELGVTTIDNYFDMLGGISTAARRARGKSTNVYIGDQTCGEGVVRTLSEQVSLETRTRLLNPKWHEALLVHGYEGVHQIETHITNTLGWSATTGQVAPWVYDQLSQTFMLDPAMRDRLATLNPKASAKIANRLIEAHERNYWTPDEATLEALRRAGEDIEDRLEGIVEGVAA